MTSNWFYGVFFGMGLLVATALLTSESKRPAEAPPVTMRSLERVRVPDSVSPDWEVWHDDKRNVTCWVTTPKHAVSCLSDSAFQTKERDR